MYNDKNTPFQTLCCYIFFAVFFGGFLWLMAWVSQLPPDLLGLGQ